MEKEFIYLFNDGKPRKARPLRVPISEGQTPGQISGIYTKAE